MGGTYLLLINIEHVNKCWAVKCFIFQREGWWCR